ncbi:MAG TPA: TetR/AcrR family transcriptional regulator [Acidimicrobiales bacterium]
MRDPESLTTAGTKRRPYRRDEILAAAVKLFHERGYHATGMDDIGAELGLSGPAIYRHFKGKEQILEILLLEAAQQGFETARDVVREAPSPTEALERLVRHYVDTIAHNPELAFVGMYERRTLSPKTRAEMERLERLHRDEWLNALAKVRTKLSPAEARVMVRATHGMAVAALVHRSGIARQAEADLVVDLAMSMLMVAR